METLCWKKVIFFFSLKKICSQVAHQTIYMYFRKQIPHEPEVPIARQIFTGVYLASYTIYRCDPLTIQLSNGNSTLSLFQ
jgi:hypothetical protein